MAQPNFDTDPGLIWSSRLKAPKHGASVSRTDSGSLLASCPACAWRSLHAFHDDAMVATLNHRAEYR